MFRKRFALFLAFSALTVTQAGAAPPPPPPPDTLAVVQAFIRASIDKNLSLYAGLLSDQFVGADAEADKIMTKAGWLASTSQAFKDKWLQTKIIHIFYGYHIVGSGLQYRVMILERLDDYPDPPNSDCCTIYRTEDLIIDGNKLRKIDRSISFNTELSDT